MQLPGAFARTRAMGSFLRIAAPRRRLLRMAVPALLAVFPMFSVAGEPILMKSAAEPGERAAIIIETHSAKDAPRTYTGFVKWGRAAQERSSWSALIAVTADVHFPDAGLAVALVFEKNNDAALPASHVISIIFTPAARSQIGEVAQIGAPYLRKENAASGGRLNGVAAAITDNHFMFGLATGEPEQHNIDLLRSGDWIEVPLQLKNDLLAKLTVEKASSGQKIIAEALEGWAQEQRP
jgi:hypothetical protein